MAAITSKPTDLGDFVHTMRVGWGDCDPARIAYDQFGDRAGRVRNNRQPACQCFDNGVWACSVQVSGEQQVGRTVERRNSITINHAGPGNFIGVPVAQLSAQPIRHITHNH